MESKDNTFIEAITLSFRYFIESGSSRSTAKLKPLHGTIAHDLASRLGSDYLIKAQGYDDDKEAEIMGRYINKKVDITIMRDNNPVAGIGVKFVMQNYSQNSNNYFENMLGETANIRANSFLYFQVFIILDRMPYYNTEKKITRWETFTKHNVSKYITLSHDNIMRNLHSPNKTLIYLIHIPDCGALTTKDEYRNFYNSADIKITLSNSLSNHFGESVIYNDYHSFINKVYHSILAL
ncbi:MAG: hypothetical protein J1F13_03835 [Prevotellaceae bacterium]|nr:hypothetical protein [Prevotellaceae bacterium]